MKIKFLLLLVLAVVTVVEFFIAFNFEGTGDTGAVCSAIQQFLKDGFVYSKPDLYFSQPPLALHTLSFIVNELDVFYLKCTGAWKVLSLLGDVAVTILIYIICIDVFRKSPKEALLNATIYALSPISILIVGYHGQLDTVWLSLILGAWYALSKDMIKVSAILTGLAIGFKLPATLLYLLLMKGIQRTSQRLTFVYISVIVVVGSFLPEVITDFEGVLRQVLMYSSVRNVWGVTRFFPHLHELPSILIAMIILSVVVTWWKYSGKVREFHIYATFVVALFLLFTPGFGYQYILWPLPFLVMYSRRLALIYIVLGSFALIHTYDIPLDVVRGVVGYLQEKVYYPSNMLYPYDLYIPLWIFIDLIVARQVIIRVKNAGNMRTNLINFVYNIRKMGSRKSIVIGGLLIVLIGLLYYYFAIQGTGINSRSKDAELSNSVNGNFGDIPVGETVEIPLKIDDGYRIGIFGREFENPRDITFSPEGVLVASNFGGGKILAAPDADKDGSVDKTIVSVEGLNKPHGIAFHDDKLYVAEVDKVSRFNWDQKTHTAKLDKKLFDVPNPGGDREGAHSTRSVSIDKNGNLYVSVGSPCNVCEDEEERFATILKSDINGKEPVIYARGLRNTVFTDIHPETGELWGADMGRDHLGDDLPPDEINIIKDGKDYGWPYCYGNKVYDTQFGRKSQAFCDTTEAPVYEMQAHVAPLGISFINSPQFEEWNGDIFVALHGSWNREPPVGYSVVRYEVENGAIVGEDEFLSGFMQDYDLSQGLIPFQSLGRPVDLAFDKEGSLYLADDYKGIVYKIAKK